MDFIIKKFIIEEGRVTHIAKHKVSMGEVLEIISGDYAIIRGKEDRWGLIGKTRKARLLTIIIAPRLVADTYALVTARPASKNERSLYKKTLEVQGGEYDESSAS